MKKTLFTLLLLVTSLFAQMNWTTYDEAFVEANKDNKIVMLMIGRSTCGVCNYMRKQVFTEQNIIEKFNARFIGVKIELDMDDSTHGLDYVGTPTFYFLDANKKTLLNFAGGKNAKSFSKALDSIN